MPYVHVNFTNGAVMTWSDVQSRMSTLRAWINDIPDTDITDATIPREALGKPATLGGFPERAFRSTFQGSYSRKFGVDRYDALDQDEWGAMPERLTIIPEAVDRSTNQWPTPIGSPLRVYTTSDVSVFCSFDLNCRSNTTGPYYPDGASGANMSRGGFFRFHYRNKTAGSNWVSVTNTTRHVYPVEFTPGHAPPFPFVDSVVMYSRLGIFARGRYDVRLVYHLGGGNDAVDQFDLTRITFNTEVL